MKGDRGTSKERNGPGAAAGSEQRGGNASHVRGLDALRAHGWFAECDVSSSVQRALEAVLPAQGALRRPTPELPTLGSGPEAHTSPCGGKATI